MSVPADQFSTKVCYLSRIVGDGSYTNPFRAAIDDVTDAKGNRVFSFSEGPSSDQQKSAIGWMLVVASAVDHSPAKGNPDVIPLPIASLDATDVGADLLKAVTGILPNTAFLSSARTYGEALSMLGKMQEPGFNVGVAVASVAAVKDVVP